MRIGLAVTLAAGFALAVGLSVGLSLGGAPGADPEDASGAVLRLERALAQALDENAALRARLDMLEARLPPPGDAAALASGSAAGDATGAEVTAADAASQAAAEAEAIATAAAAGAFAEVQGASAFDEARLRALGFHESDIERLRQTWEAMELEKLYIQNERVRSPDRDGRHWARFVALERDTIAELGEEEYDALLYASGARNRIRVRNVLPQSAADAAGLEPGDEVVVYDEEPLYRMGALKQGTLHCEQGRDVAVQVLQGGAERRVWVPCGPLGIELEMVNAEPR